MKTSSTATLPIQWRVTPLAALVATLMATTPLQAQTLRWAAQNDVLTLDPHSQNHTTTTAILQHSYEGLTRYTRDYKVEGALATEWKSISPTQIRFLLRKGVRFHDGSPFTADDVVFSFGRIKSPTSTMQAYVAGVSEVKKIDSHTVDFLLSAPKPMLTRTLVDFRIMSKAWAEKNKTTAPPNVANKEETFATRNSLGTGFTTGSTRSTFGQRISKLFRSGNDSICVLGFGGCGASPPPPTSWKIDNGTPKILTYSGLNNPFSSTS